MKDAVGGMNEDEEAVGSAERYDPAADVWETVTPITTARAEPFLALL